jgi:hypothetical protein
MSIEKKLLQFQSEVDAVKKDAKNPFFKSNYVDINGVLKAIQPTLTKCGISYSQTPDILEDGTDVLHTMIYDADKPESYIKSTSRLILGKNDMQQYGSAQTYARRYALISMLGLEAEDDDGESLMNRSSTTKKSNSGW